MKPLSHKEAATYDDKEMEAIYEKQRAENGLNPIPGLRDYIEDSRTFGRTNSPAKHQQEYWWMKKKEKNEDDKEEVGGETCPPGAVPGFWHQSPTMVNVTPMSSLKVSAGNAVSVTMEFTKEGIKATVTWDKDDFPPGLGEEQLLARVVDFLEKNVPNALASFKNISTDEVDIPNRIITLRTH